MEELEIVIEKETDSEQLINVLEEEIREIHPNYEQLTLTPSTEEQTKEGTFNKVTVLGDSSLVAENIKEGISIFGVEGNAKTTNAKITNATYLFYKGARTDYVNELISLCEKVVSTNNMFAKTENLTELDLSNLDTSENVDMAQMFSGCNKITELNLSNLNTSKVKEMKYMFEYCSKLQKLDVSSWDTSNVSSMYCMFQFDSSLTELDLRNFLTNKVSDMGYMFRGCSNLLKLNIGNFTFDKVTSYSNMFDSVSPNCEIIVKGDTEKQWVLARRSDFTNIKTTNELHIKSIEIECRDINTYANNKNTQVNITYNGGDKNLYFSEEEGYTLSLIGNATIDENGLITLNDNAQVGDKIIITAISTYDSSITATKEVEVIYREPYYEVDLNGGQWVDSGETINGNIVYKSDVGSYHISNGKSIAIIKTEGVKYLKLYIRSYAESDYDYTEAFAIDTNAIRGKGLYTTKGKQSGTNYIECVYDLDGGVHTIQVMYSKDGGGNSNDDRGYFYIGEYN